MAFKAVIHLPKERKDEEKLRREMALFRAEKTLKILREMGVTAEQLSGILRGENGGNERTSGAKSRAGPGLSRGAAL